MIGGRPKGARPAKGHQHFGESQGSPGQEKYRLDRKTETDPNAPA